MKKKLLALFITLALILTPAVAVSSVLAPSKASAEAAVVYLEDEETAKTQIKGTWNDNGTFTPENEEDVAKYTVKYYDAEGEPVAFEELAEGTTYRAVATINEEFLNDCEFDAEIRKSEEEPTVTEKEFTLTSGEQGGDENGEQGGDKQPDEPAVPMDTSMKTNIMGYVVLGMVVVCGLFALILMMTDKNKGGSAQKAPKKKKEKE